MDEAMRWVNQGLAVVALIAIGVAGWRICNILFEHVIIPLKNAATAHILTMSEYMTSTAKALDNTANALDKIADDITGIRSDMDRLHQGVEDVRQGRCNLKEGQ